MGMVGRPRTAASPARLAAAPKRPRFDVAVRHEPVLDRPRDRLAEEPLDAPQEVRLVDADEADRLARGSGPPGPADPVDVVLRVPRQLEVHDVREVLDVEPAGRHIRRNENPDLATLELLEGTGPLGLAPVAVDRDRVQALAIEPRREPGGVDL